MIALPFNRNIRLAILGVLIITVGLLTAVLALSAGALSRLKHQNVPEVKARYEQVHGLLRDVRLSKRRVDTYPLQEGVPPSVAQFRELAKTAGISRVPTFHQRDQGGRDKTIHEISTDINVQQVSADSLFRFLQSIENISGSGRILELTVWRGGKEKDQFNLNVKYSTYAAGN